MSVQLRILGSLNLDAPGGGPLDALVRQSKRMALLVYLAAAQPRGFQRRDTLLALFWPELDASHARAALNQALYVLRQALGDGAIVTRGDGEVALSADAVHCDASDMEARLDAGDAEGALRLYGGDLLQGFFISDAPGFEQWVESERARLRQRAFEGAWRVAEEKAAAGNVAEATRWARRAAEFARDDEGGVRRLMSFLRQLGDRSAALRAYEAFAWQLSRDYELEPDAETQALALAIREEGRHPATVHRVTLSSVPAILVAVRRTHPAAAVGIALVLLAAVAAARVVARDDAVALTPIRFALGFQDALPVASGVAGSTIALSPDGQLLAVLAVGARGRVLMLRAMDQLDAREMPNTVSAYAPFFSPDGSRLGFVADGEIRHAAVAGGRATAVCAVTGTIYGASWDVTDTITFATAGGVWRVAASGGTPRLVAAADTAQGESYRWPATLPGARQVIVTQVDRAGFQLVAISVADGRVRPLGIMGTNAHHVAPDHLVFARHDGALLAIRLDERRVTPMGIAVPVATGIVVGIHGAAKLGVSHGGRLAYLPEQLDSRALVRVDRAGAVVPIPVPEQRYHAVRYSKDGRRIAAAVLVAGGAQQDLWMVDVVRSTLTRLTFDESSASPEWTPDGRRIAYATSASGREPGFSIRSISWDGSDSARTILPPEQGQLAMGYSPDGSLLVQRTGARTGRDIWRLGTPGAGHAGHAGDVGGAAVRDTLLPWLRTDAEERAAVVSPDGRWVAYTSDESGRDEVYVRALAATGAPLRVSVNGGREPRWGNVGRGTNDGNEGRELFYRGEGRLRAVSLEMAPAPVITRREALFDDAGFVAIGDASAYDVHPDGRTFLMIRRGPQRREVVIALHVFDSLRVAERRK